MTKTTIQSIEERLRERQQQLEQELRRYGKYEDFGRSEDENAAEVASYSDGLSLEHALEKELRDVVNALSRIMSGSYGTCRYCGEEIPMKRLEARPTSSSCVACKVEKKKGAVQS